MTYVLQCNCKSYNVLNSHPYLIPLSCFSKLLFVNNMDASGWYVFTYKVNKPTELFLGISVQTKSDKINDNDKCLAST